MGKIIFEGQEISFDMIKGGHWPMHSQYLSETLDFCQEWLNGKAEFQLQTSGSTGNPKTITVSRRQMQISAAATGAFFEIPVNSTLLCCLNTSMIAGRMMLVRAMEWDSLLHLREPEGLPLATFSAQQYWDFVAMVPAQVENCLMKPAEKQKLQSIAKLIIGGAPLSSQVQLALSQIPIKAYQTYGMTETVSHIALAEITGSLPLIYQVLPGVVINTSEDGQLIIDAPMAEQRLHTHDRVEIIGTDRFHWLGRSDFTINSGGVKIQPEIVEQKIAGLMNDLFPGTRYIIAGAAHEKWGEEVILLIEGAEASDLIGQLMEGMAEQLEKYHRPKKVLFIENFASTPSSKIKRKESLSLALEKAKEDQ